MLKILFLDNQGIWIDGLPGGFKSMGCEVNVSWPQTKEVFDQITSNFKPDLIFTLGAVQKYTVEHKEWLREYVKKTKARLIHWDTEGITHIQKYVMPFIESLNPHFVFTVCPEMFQILYKKSIRSARLDYGYNPAVHYKAKYDPYYKSKIAVIGDGYPYVLRSFPDHYRTKSVHTLIKPLVENNIRVDFWGRQWNLISPLIGTNIPNHWIRGYCNYFHTNKVYSNTDINIGCQNHNLYLSRRTFEILGSEGFLITYDTKEIRRLFKPGQDLVVSSSPKETLELVNYYLNHPNECKRIGEKGKNAIKNHTYKHRANYIINTLKKEGMI
jgi:spore maturation protein CgeB